MSTAATIKEKPKTKPNDALSVRMRPEWDAWLDRFAAHTRRQRSNLVDEALATYAARIGFESPPRRV